MHVVGRSDVNGQTGFSRKILNDAVGRRVERAACKWRNEDGCRTRGFDLLYENRKVIVVLCGRDA